MTASAYAHDAIIGALSVGAGVALGIAAFFVGFAVVLAILERITR